MSRRNKRLSYDFVKKQFEKEGCKLISREYINARTPLDYICSCGERSMIRYDNFRQGKRCNVCRYRKIAEKRRHDYDFVKKYFEEQGCKLLSDTYVNTQTKLKYQCECGEISEIRFGNFRNGQRCGKCRIRKISGKNSPHYKPHLTEEHRAIGRNCDKLRTWRKEVFERDDYTCFKCNQRGGTLNAHHINSYDEFPDERTKTSNGVTLCEGCHTDFHSKYGYGNNTVDQFQEWLET